MSSTIKSRACASCAQSLGIDTPSHKIHDNKVCKIDMRIIVEEVRAHQLVMTWGMVFGVVVAKVGASGVPLYLELAMAGAIHDPVETHFD